MLVRSFATAARWRAWLQREHARSTGLWVRIFKKGSGRAGPTYAEILDEALCFGWIDGQRKAVDERSFLQRLTPRRPRSLWSKVNLAHAARLIRAGKMRAAGRRELEKASADGRAGAAYDSFSTAKVPADFRRRLAFDPKASDFFATLNRTNLYSIVWRLQTAKRPETRARRMDAIIEMLRLGKTFHPQKRTPKLSKR